MSYMLKSGRELGAVDASTFVANYNVRRGSTGERVRTVQFLLNVFGAGLETDAIFGPLTEAAVRGFQRANGLEIDGVVGPITSRALQDDESRNIGQSPPTTVKPPSGGGARPSRASRVLALLGLGAAGLGGVWWWRRRKRRGHRIAGR